MHIQRKDGRFHSKFYVEEDGSEVAEIVYTKKDDVLVIEHTEVDEALRGRNMGYELVEKVVEYARENKFKIEPVCPFAAAVFEKKEEWSDVLA